MELSDQARNLFIKAAKTLKRSGEPGELILFTLLEALFDAPQVACKMYLKTSENTAVHGSDSIHAKYDSEAVDLKLIWGESKLYQQLSAALNEICASISTFNCRNQGRSLRERDIDILKDHANISDPEIQVAFLDFFDPYTPQVSKRKEVFCCLSGFDFSIYNNLAQIAEDEVETFFKNKYMRRISEACLLFKEKIMESGIDHLDFIFILLPFRSVAEFRKLFYNKLGWYPNDKIA